LISDNLSKENNLDVSNEELRDFMKAEVTRYFGNMSIGDDTGWLDTYVDRMMKDEKQVESHYHRLSNEKLFKWMESQVSPAEKEVSAEELAAMQHHHHH
jgi:trigger factor